MSHFLVTARVRLPVLAFGFALIFFTGCASRSPATADTVMRDVAIQRQQAEQAPAVPNSRNLYVTLIKEMQSKGLYYASLAHVDAFEKQYGADPQVEMLRGDALRETGQNDAALAVYQTLCSGKTEAPAQHGVGRVLAAEGRYPESIVALDAAARLDPTNIVYLNDLGFAYLAAGQIPRARLPILQAAELAPSNKKVVANLVLYMLMNGDSVRADDVIARAQLAPETVAATKQLAQKLMLGNQVSQARASTEKVQQRQEMAAAGRRDPLASESSAARAATSTALTWPSGTALERFGNPQ